ncbi:TPA: hypothetical protein ANIA_11448 [Aspergillus nidulans FGSC A4]|uniref:Uncharacterized protein n=1 Tax=Emericella nidulans (strain FGSC A4 / ATCC 38163 / CBS 112.46 / NRRL 194 / M139) TaxID=227321 RepID=C8VA89_EMENI|nr:TPA: hypothetical protein ANIA_11448 [Aspergillus nidulans FGSC A4]
MALPVPHGLSSPEQGCQNPREFEYCS